MKKAMSYQYNQTKWLFNVGYYSEVSSSLLYVQELFHWLLSLAILSSPFSSNTTFQSSPNIPTPIFLVSRSLSHITNFFLSSMFNLLVKSDIFLSNAYLAMVILILISLAQYINLKISPSPGMELAPHPLLRLKLRSHRSETRLDVFHMLVSHRKAFLT